MFCIYSILVFNYTLSDKLYNTHNRKNTFLQIQIVTVTVLDSFGNFLSCKLNARKSVHKTRYHRIIALINH